MGVVDVVPGAVRQHRVHEMRLDLGRHRALASEAARVTPRRLVLEVPADPALQLRHVGVDQDGRRRDRVGLARAALLDAVLRLETEDLAKPHSGNSTLQAAQHYRYWPVPTRSIALP